MIREAGTVVIIILVVAFLSLFPNKENRNRNDGKITVKPASSEVVQ